MSENRCSCNAGGASSGARETICIDTNRVLDSCRDRDCFENARVYLTPTGQEIIERTASSVRAVSANILWTYVGVDAIRFNRGFYQVSARFYIRVKLEACVGLGRSQEFYGVAVLDKSVVLYGGEGNVSIFTSDPEGSRCMPWNSGSRTSNMPSGVVETVEPVILGSPRIVVPSDCGCTCYCVCSPDEIPQELLEQNELCGLIDPANGSRLYVSLGLFTVFRIERPAQLLVNAANYSVPDKECTCAEPADPCSLFRTMAFPTGEFSGTPRGDGEEGGGCGCRK